VVGLGQVDELEVEADTHASAGRRRKIERADGGRALLENERGRRGCVCTLRFAGLAARGRAMAVPAKSFDAS